MHAATHMEGLWESSLKATNGMNMLAEMSCSKVHKRELKCKGGCALKCSSTQHMELHWHGGHIHFCAYFVTKSHTENYIDGAGIPAGRKHKSSKSSYTSSSITLPELSDFLKLIQFIKGPIYKHRPFSRNKFLQKIFVSSLNFPLIISIHYGGIKQLKS